MMGYNVVMNEILRSPLRSLSVLDEMVHLSELGKCACVGISSWCKSEQKDLLRMFQISSSVTGQNVRRRNGLIELFIIDTTKQMVFKFIIE